MAKSKSPWPWFKVVFKENETVVTMHNWEKLNARLLERGRRAVTRKRQQLISKKLKQLRREEREDG